MTHITTKGNARPWGGAFTSRRLNASVMGPQSTVQYQRSKNTLRGESSRRLLCNLLPLQRGRALPGQAGRGVL
jgi:hypothetical protein